MDFRRAYFLRLSPAAATAVAPDPLAQTSISSFYNFYDRKQLTFNQKLLILIKFFQEILIC